jgi:hypothetical protein
MVVNHPRQAQSGLHKIISAIEVFVSRWLGSASNATAGSALTRLKHLWQIRAASGATVAPILRLLYRTVCGQFIQPIDYFGAAVTICDQSL